MRRNAMYNRGQKRERSRTSRPAQCSKEEEPVLSRRLNAYERFFAALLRSSPHDFTNSCGEILLETICKRVNLPVPTEAIKSKYHDAKSHFAARAALVLEESRHQISEALFKQSSSTTRSRSKQKRNMKQRHRQKPTSSKLRAKQSATGSMNVVCISKTRDVGETGYISLEFQNLTKFTKEQLFHLRAATVVECRRMSAPNEIESAVLGCIRNRNRDGSESNSVFSVMIFRETPTIFSCSDDGDGDKHEEEWQVTPVVGLISEFRQFDACTSRHVGRIPFLTALLGHFPKHTRFTSGSSEDDEEHEQQEEDGDEGRDRDDYNSLTIASSDGRLSPDDEDSTNSEAHYFDLPTLNGTQETAATQFLNSVKNSITMVQGPPGSGKSLLIVSIICRYLSMPQSKDSRLMVCAPTNKAVAVLAARLLDALGDNFCLFNVVLVGDSDKLMENDNDDGSGWSASCPSLQSIFIYTWIENVVKEYRKLQQIMSQYASFDRMGSSLRDLWYKKSIQLRNRIIRSLPVTSQGSIEKHADEICSQMRSPDQQIVSYFSTMDSIDHLIAELSDVAPDDICSELMKYGKVIFCTLATSGGSIFKRAPKINDLVVDEAAASTEAELSIPFHLRPRRLLAVGDPMQLPATVLSRKAASLGFEKSLHHRLMHECSCPHIMLDVQYRMRPEISSFPSQKFYEGKLMDGHNVRSSLHRNCSTLLNGQPYAFLQVEGREEQAANGSYRNGSEAQIVVDLIQRLRSSAKANASKTTVRVITFYQAQVALVKHLLVRRGLRNVLVATVDASQGCEAEIVIVSFVRSNAGHKLQNGPRKFSAGFLNDDRRLNVSLTRAKYQLICVGNVAGINCMPTSTTLNQLVRNAGARNCIVDGREDKESPGARKCKR